MHSALHVSFSFFSLSLLFALIDEQAWVVVGGREEISLRFHELVPDMALDFPFELDTFQKEVVIIIIYSRRINFYFYFKN